MPLPEDVKFAPGKVLLTAKKLAAATQSLRREELFQNDVYDRFVSVALDVLKLGPACEPSVRKALIPFYGRKMTRADFDGACLRVSALRRKIKFDIPFLDAFSTTKDLVWNVLVVESSEYSRLTKSKKAIVNVEFTVLEGDYAGLSLAQDMPQRYVTLVMARELGTSWKHDPVSVRSVVGFRLIGGIRLDVEYQPKVEEIYGSDSLRMYNRLLLSTRQAVEDYHKGLHNKFSFTWRCPNRYSGPCTICPRGRDTCTRGTHRRTYVESFCRKCRNEKAWFDPPAVKTGVCVNCRVKAVRQGAQ